MRGATLSEQRGPSCVRERVLISRYLGQKKGARSRGRQHDHSSVVPGRAARPREAGLLPIFGGGGRKGEIPFTNPSRGPANWVARRVGNGLITRRMGRRCAKTSRAAFCLLPWSGYHRLT